MKVLGKIDFKIILYVGVLEVLFTVLLCYVLAVTLQHKPLWLPTISECGELEPEKHFFRWGIMFGGLLLMLEAVVLYLPQRITRLEFILGLVAGFCLTGVSVVASNENLDIHMVFALAFFILEDIMVLLMTLNGYQSMTFKSLAIKIPSVTVACLATTARILIIFDVVTVKNDIMLIVAIIEWINVIALLLYHISLSDELDDLYIAELEEDSQPGLQADTGDKAKPLSIKTPL